MKSRNQDQIVKSRAKELVTECNGDTRWAMSRLLDEFLVGMSGSARTTRSAEIRIMGNAAMACEMKRLTGEALSRKQAEFRVLKPWLRGGKLTAAEHHHEAEFYGLAPAEAD